MDALRAQHFWQHHQYHYTAPVSGLLALHEAPAAGLRGDAGAPLCAASALVVGPSKPALSRWGWCWPRRVPIRLNSVVAIQVPTGVDNARVRADMSSRFHVEISGAFGLDIVRIGQMGEQCRAPHLFRVLHALGGALTHEGAAVDTSGRDGRVGELFVALRRRRDIERTRS